MIYIVSGLPRCGTSLMMQMLDAAGVPVVTDHVREPDHDNPKGYYEYEPIKRIKDDPRQVENCEGRCVKMVSELLKYLPKQHAYTVFFMERDLDEVIESQNKMLDRLGKNVLPSRIKLLYKKHLKAIKDWLSRQDNIVTYFINYNRLIKEPENIKPLASKIGVDASEMISAIKPDLYRNRHGVS